MSLLIGRSTRTSSPCASSAARCAWKSSGGPAGVPADRRASALDVEHDFNLWLCALVRSVAIAMQRLRCIVCRRVALSGDMTMGAKHFGARVARLEDPALLTGRGAFRRRHAICPARCTPASCAARTPTPGSVRSTPRRRAPCRACTPCSRPTTCRRAWPPRRSRCWCPIRRSRRRARSSRWRATRSAMSARPLRWSSRTTAISPRMPPRPWPSISSRCRR